MGGTNGKGSTAAFLAAALRAAGWRTGLYTSPHLVSFTERVLVDGVPVSEGAVAAWTGRLEATALERDASFFEIATALAFADFAARGVEIAVVEVGLGGRLDATNVIEPLAAGVTRIALEHTDYLGDTLEGIAKEKAGIAKAGVPLLTTEQDPSLLGVMRAEAEARGAALEVVDPARAAGLRLGLSGEHQVANASLALALAERLPEPWRPTAEEIHCGLAEAELPGRFDRRGPYIFDVAHNPDGARALARALREENVRGRLRRPVAAVVAVLRDKDWRGMLTELANVVDGFVLSRAPSAPAERAWDLDAALAWATGQGLVVEADPDLMSAVARAHARAGTVLVTGSFHTVGDAMARLPGFSLPG